MKKHYHDRKEITERKQKEKHEKAEENSMKRLRFKHWKEDRPLQERQQKYSRKHKEKVTEKIESVHFT